MDFNDTPEETEFRAEARAWLDANATPLDQDAPAGAQAGARMEEGVVERAQAWQAQKADAGWACITWPKEFGGRDASSIQNVIWKQEEARYAVPPNIFTIGQGMLGPTLMAHGTDEQKSLYLEKMLRGEEIWCQLFSEPGAGSDLAGLRTSARARRRRVDHQRPEDLDERRPLLQVGHGHHAQRPERGQARRASPTSSSTCIVAGHRDPPHPDR